MIEGILTIHKKWQKEVAEKYPRILARTRPADTTEDTDGQTSVETYLRGELETYSEQTLALYYKNTLEKEKRGENECAENLLNQMRQYGFTSLEACERLLAAHASNEQKKI